MHDEQDHFHQQDEHPEDGGDYVESCGAVEVLVSGLDDLVCYACIE